MVITNVGDNSAVRHTALQPMPATSESISFITGRWRWPSGLSEMGRVDVGGGLIRGDDTSVCIHRCIYNYLYITLQYINYTTIRIIYISPYYINYIYIIIIVFCLVEGKRSERVSGYPSWGRTNLNMCMAGNWQPIYFHY